MAYPHGIDGSKRRRYIVTLNPRPNETKAETDARLVAALNDIEGLRCTGDVTCIVLDNIGAKDEKARWKKLR